MPDGMNEKFGSREPLYRFEKLVYTYAATVGLANLGSLVKRSRIGWYIFEKKRSTTRKHEIDEQLTRSVIYNAIMHNREEGCTRKCMRAGVGSGTAVGE